MYTSDDHTDDLFNIWRDAPILLTLCYEPGHIYSDEENIRSWAAHQQDALQSHKKGDR